MRSSDWSSDVCSSDLHEVPEAIRKAVEHAKKDLIYVPLRDTTLPCEITGRYGSGRVFLRPATQGTGPIAGGSVRPVLEIGRGACKVRGWYDVEISAVVVS